MDQHVEIDMLLFGIGGACPYPTRILFQPSNCSGIKQVVEGAHQTGEAYTRMVKVNGKI